MGNGVSLYESLAADPRLRGHRPNAIVIDEKDEIYISVQDAASVAKISPGRIRGLVSESRLTAIKPGGHDLFILLDSVDYFLTEGRKTPGRPQKDDD